MAQIQLHQSGAAVPGPNGVAAGPGAIQFVPTSLYVGDLDFNVTDSQLYDVFNQVGQVVSVRVCRDLSTRRSLGYGYVNYSNPQDAARALDVLNFTPLNNKPIRIMYSHRDPSIRKSGMANIFIKNLDKGIDHKALHDTFSSFGNILSCKVATDASGQSKGYGFVQFDSEEAAQNAIDKLNGMLINDKQVYVGHFLRKQDRDGALYSIKFNNVFVKNLAESTTDEDLKIIFAEHGAITSAVVMRDADGKSKCFGFVNFESADDAAKAVEALNGKKIDGEEWYVGKAQKKSERELELKGRFEQSMKETVDKFQGLNLYIKNLDDSINDEKLKELFSDFGTITSCKVMRDPSGISRGSGFVAFSTPEEASRALAEMNGKMLISKPLYVALAQRKEERRAKLQAQFSQMRPVTMAPSVASRMPMYPPGAPGMGQQFLYGQGPPAMMPPQAGFGYQQQLVPGMRPGGAPMPNFFVPLVQQGQQGQRPGGRRGGGPVQQTQQPVPLMQQQMLPRGRVYRYPPGRNMPDVPMPGVAGGMLSVPYDMGGMPIRDATQPMPITALATALANATPEQQRTMLGESLYPIVDQLEHDSAAKVTGMLLEMDQTEVLHLLESPEALKPSLPSFPSLTHILSSALVNDQLYANHKSPCFYFLVLLLFFSHSVAAESSTPVWFEPVSVAKSRRIVSVAKYVTFASPNEDELIAMANALSHENMFCQIEKDSNSRCSVESLFQFLKPAILVLLEKGIKIVAVTLGADGVFLCSRGPNVVRFSLDRTKKYGFSGQLYDKVVSSFPSSRFSGALQIERSSHLFSVHFPALPASVVRLTGAGDCLVGGTLASLCSGLDIMQSIAVGIAAAKSAVEGEANVPSKFSLTTITDDARSIYSAAKIPFHQSTL